MSIPQVLPMLLYESRYGRLELDESRQLVRYTRSATPFDTLDDAMTMFREVIAAGKEHGRRGCVLLSDVRLAVGRNDPEFERVLQALRGELFGAYPKRATLVRTVVGKLQIQRLNHEAQTTVEVFDDEAAALGYLLSPRGAATGHAR
ncbi:MAG: hypothetical protein K1X94_22655 [Sandaracinaceae bacterium]|nr:hypothetical protein [Sandaracinaceae bacterium]